MKPAEFASLLCEKLEKLKLDNNNEEARKMNESQMPILQDQCMSSPYHHAPSNNMLRPSFYLVRIILMIHNRGYYLLPQIGIVLQGHHLIVVLVPIWRRIAMLRKKRKN